VKAETEAKLDDRLTVFMTWVESKLVKLTNSAKVAGRPAEDGGDCAPYWGGAEGPVAD
jgi:hypothetical protein